MRRVQSSDDHATVCVCFPLDPTLICAPGTVSLQMSVSNRNGKRIAMNDSVASSKGTAVGGSIKLLRCHSQRATNPGSILSSMVADQATISSKLKHDQGFAI